MFIATRSAHNVAPWERNVVHCAPLERGNQKTFEGYKHLALPEPGNNHSANVIITPPQRHSFSGFQPDDCGRRRPLPTYPRLGRLLLLTLPSLVRSCEPPKANGFILGRRNGRVIPGTVHSANNRPSRPACNPAQSARQNHAQSCRTSSSRVSQQFGRPLA